LKNKYLFNARLQFSPSAAKKVKSLVEQPGSTLSSSSGV